MKHFSTKNIIIIGILSALSFILMLINVPLPFFPPFLKIDIADIPAYIGFALFGGGVGFLIIILKIVLYAIIAASEPIGPIGNLLASISFLVPIYLIYRNKKTNKSLITGILVGTLVLTVILSLLNYFVLLPLYGMIIDQRDIVENLKTLITVGIIPFNIVKGLLVGAVIYLVHIKIIPVLRNITEKNTRL
ncbi:ECF transporter S component [Phocicoccus pinnipedialis]|uniref:Riboflavin transporter n=1 Tax=Phocicoccus pinnipedialis TaxID=110845 RepID=A0A6V7RD92_9BACL|nr:ECF transporter S component [Jeotgalicoccus pinnipedialis]MBP1939353.1 riboflavin transporter FmnP [Jeotgalicoccus pinnipedialis]CAD2075729.1 Riboflavin transporter RibU [Jeotgalicoccus pinnipedialis]